MDFTDWLDIRHDKDTPLDDYGFFLARQEWLSIYRPNLFYVGLNPRWQMYKFLPDKINVMFSAAGFWDDDKREWRKGAKFKKSFGKRFLDSGGFTLLNKYVDYPFSTINLANLIGRLRPHSYVPRDYPCEPEISRSLGLMTNVERIKATVANAVELAEWESQLPGRMVPVIQGYTLREYLLCLRLYREAGMIRDYMAVGSMCRRISNEELGQLIPGIYYAAQKMGCTKLHFFGLKLSPALEPYNEMIYSRDSAVSLASSPQEWRQQRNMRRFPRGQQEKEEVFGFFLKRLDRMGLKWRL
jgi:hypothetical protein